MYTNIQVFAMMTHVNVVCAMLQPSSMEQKFLAVGAGKQHRPPGIVDNTLDAPTAALMGEQMLAVQNTL